MAIVRYEAVALLPLMFGIAMALPFSFNLPIFGGRVRIGIGGGRPGFFGRWLFGPPEDYETDYMGKWELVSPNSGVSGMHLQLMPTGKVVMFDATNFGPSKVQLPAGHCRVDPNFVRKEDCWAHAVEYDVQTAHIRPLEIPTNTWCSSGALDRNGQLVQTGGWNDGGRGVRYYVSCPTCDWTEYSTALSAQRWYSSQHILPDGNMIVVGGRRQYTYEFVPARGKANPAAAAVNLPFLRQTCDDPRSVMNNLYPFLYLLPDGNLFLFANNRSILLDPATHRLVHSFPTLPGGSRNYPSSGSSALLPLRLRPYADDDPATAEVIICGGAPPDSAHLAANGRFVPALSTCGRLVVTRPGADWEMEEMPTPRTMADMLLLPDANLLVVNGARRGCAGWNYADDPALEPWVYRPGDDEGERFTTLAATTIPRMYHSSSAVLPDGRILVAGSNTNAAYNLTGVKFPTELRVEKFSPHYLDPDLADHRPAIVGGAGELGYGRVFTVRVAVEEEGFEPRVTMLLPPFTTHGYSMNQRMLVLHVKGVEATGEDEYDVEVEAPATASLAPPGYYLLFVVNRGLPSEGAWTRIQ